MDTKTLKIDVLETSAAALPTSFVANEESASLTKMLQLELEQASQIAGGMMKTVRCCAAHCCSCHC